MIEEDFERESGRNQLISQSAIEADDYDIEEADEQELISMLYLEILEDDIDSDVLDDM